MKPLILLNDPSCGTERSFNGLRMAHALANNDPEGEITIFLIGRRRALRQARSEDARRLLQPGADDPSGSVRLGSHSYVRQLHGGRSIQGAALLRQLGHQDALWLEGGTNGWLEQTSQHNNRNTGDTG